MMRRMVVVGALAVFLLPLSGRAAGPNQKKLDMEVAAWWKKQWPDQTVVHVAKKSECEKGDLEDPTRKDKTGKPRRLSTCLIKADIYLERGFRILIYRETHLHFVGNTLKGVQLGELQKSWKDGMPLPTSEQVVAEVMARLQALGATQPVINVREISRQPRIAGDNLRASALLDIACQKDGREIKAERTLLTFETDGTEWRALPTPLF